MLLVAAIPPAAFATEEAPAVDASAILGEEVNGPNYAVESEVSSDGFMHVFRLTTAAGTYEVRSDALMRERLRELAALRRLNEMSQSDQFTQALRQEAGRPVQFATDLINDPSRTIRGSASGIANMFNRAASAVSNRGASRENTANSLLGVDTARRTLAFQVGVDPYTDFPPLAARLNDMANAVVGAQLSIRAVSMLIPGGTIAGAASTGNRAEELLRDLTPAQIADRVRQVLGTLGVSHALANRLIENRQYTPADLLFIAGSLNTLRARGTELYVARAADAVARDEAYFYRRRAEILGQHGRTLGIVEFVRVAGFPLNRARDGRFLAVFPFDQLAWTETTARAFNGATEELRRDGRMTNATLAITGTVTEMTRTELTTLGWIVLRLS
jgi:hypothetical protein